MTEEKKKISRRSYLKYAGAAVAAGAIAAAGYGIYETTKPAPTVTPTQGKKFSTGKGIVVGALTTITGPYASLGQSSLEGTRLAVEDINAAGGVFGEPVTILEVDTEGSTDLALRRLQDLVERKAIDFTSGFITSAEGWAVNEWLKKNYSVFVGVHLGCEAILMHKGVIVRPLWLGGSMPRNDQEARVLCEYTAKHFGPKHYFLTLDQVWGHELRNEALSALKIHGGYEVENQMVPIGTLDYSSYLSRIKATEADVVFTTVVGGMLTALFKQAAEAGVSAKVKFVHPELAIMDCVAAGGPDVWQGVIGLFDSYYKAPQWAAENNLGPDVLDQTKAKAMYDKYMSKTGHIPNEYSTGPYITTMELLSAVKRSGTTDPDTISKELEGRTFEYHKGPMYCRPCDKQCIQNVFIAEGKTPAESDPNDKYDLFKILDVKRAEPPNYMWSCEEEGYGPGEVAGAT